MSRTAAGFAYPPTPDVAGQLRAERMAAIVQLQRAQPHRVRRLVLAAVVLIGLCSALLSVPTVRAALVNLLRIGAVQITLTQPTATPTTHPSPKATTTFTPTATPRPLSSVLDLGGETTLVAARASVSFTLKLPAYPDNLGQPDAVFVQDLGDQAVMLVWRDRAQPTYVQRMRLALNIVGPNSFIEKIQPRVVRETTVNGQPALWTVGEYLLLARNGDIELKRLITGSVLIWKEGILTYRLETDLPMEEAVKIAESLR